MTTSNFADTETTIFDLDHAPEPPSGHASFGLLTTDSHGGTPFCEKRRSWPRRRAQSEDLSPNRPRITGGSFDRQSQASLNPASLAMQRRTCRSERFSFSNVSRRSRSPDQNRVSNSFGSDRVKSFENSIQSLPEDSLTVCSLDPPYLREFNMPLAPFLAEEEERSSDYKKQNGADSHSDDVESRDDRSLISDAIPEADLGWMKLWEKVAPLCCCTIPSRSMAASWVATNAPCFLFYKRDGYLTDRNIVGRLNLLISFFAMCQIGSALFLVIVIHGPYLVDRRIFDSDGVDVTSDSYLGVIRTFFSNTWVLNTFIYPLGLVAVILVLATMLTVRVIRSVNLVGCVRFLWTLLWILPFVLLWSLSLFDFFVVTEVWIKHWWRDRTMGWFRAVSCSPPSSANTLCAVPISGNATAWCLMNFNSTSCEHIRDAAQKTVLTGLLAYFSCSGVWGLGLVVLMILTVHTLERLVSKPLIRKSSQTSLPMWLLLPAIGCITAGAVISFTRSSGFRFERHRLSSVIGPLYITTGALFFVGSLLGWFIWYKDIKTTRDKHHKVISIIAFIVTLGASLLILVVLFFISMGLISAIEKNGISDGFRGKVACILDETNECSRCDAVIRRCPEWSEADVTKVLKTQAKISAFTSAVFLVYSIAALRFGFGMKRYVTKYQIDFV